MSLSASPVRAETRPDRLLRLDDVVELTALSRATVYRQVAAGNFPAPVKIAGASRWSESEVARFIEALKSGREGNRR
jgi:prophage regulatory protein